MLVLQLAGEYVDAAVQPAAGVPALVQQVFTLPVGVQVCGISVFVGTPAGQYVAHEIVGQPAMDRYRAEELAPGPNVRTDDEIDDFVRQNMESTMHPCGTCRMGEDDMAVVDSQLRVRGLQGLRVIDSSVFPTEPNGNLNAPTIMVAERASDLVRGRTPLAPERAPVGLVPDWADRQRSGKPLREVAV